MRSASNWSLGLDRKENSIQEAYLSLIENSNHYIYIENQFFISSTSCEKSVENQIVQKLADRVIRAIKRKEKFMVIIVIPLLPALSGDILQKDGFVTRTQIEWHSRTISKGARSLIQQVQKVENDWQKYIKIFGMRNHGIIGDTPV